MTETLVRVDYDRVWSDQMKDMDHGNSAGEYWNRRAQTFDSVWRTSSYVSDLMQRITLRDDYSVLDVACGAGIITIPMAERVNHVTALDISSVMLERLQSKITTAGLPNVNLINADWNRVIPYVDIFGHDVVLLSRSVMINNKLSETLQKMDSIATAACYVTWRVNRQDELQTAIAGALGREKAPYPDYRIICGCLRQMGIEFKTDVFETKDEERYPTLELAAIHFAKGNEVDEEKFTRLLEVMKERLLFINGLYSITKTTMWALISWYK